MGESTLVQTRPSGHSRGQVSTRQAVWDRDGGACGICGDPADPAEWNLDHIVPVALGGPTVQDNLRVSHPRCNRRRPIPTRMTDEEIYAAATEWTANEFDLDQYPTITDWIEAHARRPDAS